MRKVTAEEVCQAVIKAGVTRVNHHACGLCSYMTAYFIVNGSLFFDPGCDCVAYDTPMEHREWQDAADWINMQNDTNQPQLMKAFGMEVDDGQKTSEPDAA